MYMVASYKKLRTTQPAINAPIARKNLRYEGQHHTHRDTSTTGLTARRGCLEPSHCMWLANTIELKSLGQQLSLYFVTL